MAKDVDVESEHVTEKDEYDKHTAKKKKRCSVERRYKLQSWTNTIRSCGASHNNERRFT